MKNCMLGMLALLAGVFHGRSWAQNPTQYLHVISTGQSLALGFTSIPALSTTQPYNNLSLSSDLMGYTPPLIPLVEIGNMESPSSGIVNTLHALDSLSRPVVMGMHGSSGAPYADLKKGSPPYARAMAQVNVTKSEVEAMTNTAYVPVCVTVVHGEADNNSGNASAYKGYLEEWQHDYETDISAIMGTAVNFPMLVSQMNTGWTGEMAVAQYEAHKANPGKIILIGPKYHYDYSDELHLHNFESKHLGEMFAKVIHEVVLKGNTWNPLMPTSVIRAGNVITVDYHIPVGTLVLDTTTVVKRPHYGFEFLQTGGNAVNITDVALVSGDTKVQIVLDAVPTGTDQLLRYAYTCYHGGTGYPMCGNGLDGTSVGGNIRDTDASISPAIGGTGRPLYDWGVTFEEAVIDQASAVIDPYNPILKAYPNPAHSVLQLELDTNGRALEKLVLQDLSGKAVRDWKTPSSGANLELPLQGVTPGLYVLHVVVQGGHAANYKVVVQ